jgi:hypothetical protein
MSYKKHITKGLTYSAFGAVGLILASSISGCDNNKGFENSREQEAQNAFFVLKQLPDGSYEVIEKHPTNGPSRGIVRDQNGSERFLSNEELTKMVRQDAQKMDRNQNAQIGNNGMSMGEAIMAAAGGAILGTMIGSALANRMGNNQRFQSNQRNQMNKPGFSRSVNKSTKASSSSKSKRGFFGKRSGGRSFGGFGG